jgi:thioester reductase-like protein
MQFFLTGATGFLGGELLVVLSERPEIKKIFCLIRADSDAEALRKIENVFSLHDNFFDKEKVVPIVGNLQDERLSRSLIEDKRLLDVDVIIHAAANTSFSRVYDGLVDEVNITGLERILSWAKELPCLKTFLYIGTATICGKNIRNRLIHEDESPDPAADHLVRYTYSKMQGELLLDKYLPAEKILVARPSIIMGDSRPVVPRSPVMLWAVATINQLRFSPVHEHAFLDVIPVDFAAEAIVKLLFAKRHYRVYHISSGEEGSTTAHKLSLHGDYFSELPPFKFVNKRLLEQMKQWARGRLAPDSELQNYPIYLDYWNRIFPDPRTLRILLAGLEPYLQFMDLGQIFDNSRLFQDVPDLKKPIPGDVYLDNSLQFIASIDTVEGSFDA